MSRVFKASLLVALSVSTVVSAKNGFQSGYRRRFDPLATFFDGDVRHTDGDNVACHARGLRVLSVTWLRCAS